MYRGIHSALIYVADNQGFFRKRGVDVVIREYETGVLAVNDLIANKVDIATAAEFVLALQSLKHTDMRTPGTICIGSDHELVVRKDHGIVKPQDLRGKRVAVTRGSSSEFFLYNYLLFNRIPAQSVHVVGMTRSEMIKAMSDGTIDAVLSVPPYTAMIAKDLGPNGARWPAQSGQDYYFALVAKEGFLKQQSKSMEAFLAALTDAEGFVGKHPDRAEAILQHMLKIDRETFLATWSGLRFQLQLTQDLLCSWNGRQNGQSETNSWMRRMYPTISISSILRPLTRLSLRRCPLSTKTLLFHPFAAMSIRTKLRISAGITIGFALIVALTVFVASRNIEQAESQDRFVERVIKDVSDLNSLSYAYLLFKDKRPKAQWQIKYASLGKALSEHTTESVTGKDLLARLRSNHEQMKQLFEAASEGANGGGPVPAKPSSSYDELKEGVTAQLLARAEMMSNDASLLGRESEQLRDYARKTSFILVLASALILMVSAAATASLLTKSIGGSIRRLKQGTQRIASGDLAFRLAMQTKDELGDLARSFDSMTEQLQTVTVARDSLEQEIEERKRAKEALRQSEERLGLAASATRIGMFDWNLTSNTVLWTQTHEAIFGYTPALLLLLLLPLGPPSSTIITDGQTAYIQRTFPSLRKSHAVACLSANRLRYSIGSSGPMGASIGLKLGPFISITATAGPTACSA